MSSGLPRGPWKKMLILTEGRTDRYDAKTAAGLVRYCRDEVVAILDSRHAGRDVGALLGAGAGIPVVADVPSALPLGPRTFVIGIAPSGGAFPVEWRRHVIDALDAGLDILSGLHQFLGDVPDFAALAARRGRQIFDVRRPRPDVPVGTNRAATLKAKRVLTVGSDCNIGKKHTAIEVTVELLRRGRRADFVATGQTGIMITGRGVPLDHVLSDFVAGAIEQELMARAAENHEVFIVEGQGAVLHPGFSGVTLGLMHGTAPDGMIFCHNPTRKAQRGGIVIPALAEQIRLHEDLCRHLHPSRVIAVALNCAELDEAAAHAAVRKTEEETGLPTTDAVRFGASVLADAVEAML